LSRAVAGTVLAAVAVALLSAAPRVLLASGTLPELLRPFIWSDALLTYERGLSGHRLPYRDSPFEYPPLVGAFSGLLSLASSDATLYVLLWGLVVAAFAGAGAAVLARAAGPRRTLAYWSLAPQLLLLGGVNFDVLATALLVVAAVAQRSGRELAAMLGLAAGSPSRCSAARGGSPRARSSWRRFSRSISPHCRSPTRARAGSAAMPRASARTSTRYGVSRSARSPHWASPTPRS